MLHLHFLTFSLLRLVQVGLIKVWEKKHFTSFKSCSGEEKSFAQQVSISSFVIF